MEKKDIERQQHFIELATAHAEDFKTRVAQHDRENSFPFENVEALKASGYTAITVPEELGGGGANVLDLVRAQEQLARGDGPTVVAVNMHLYGTAMFADLWRLGDESLRPFLESIAREQRLMAAGVSDPRMNSGVGLAGINDTTRRAEKRDGGYVINGRAGFGTMSACADFLLGTAHYDDPERGPLCLTFFVPKDTPGIKIQTNWDTMSIRSSSSNDIVWENVFVPEENIMPRLARTWDTFDSLFAAWLPSLDAPYVGLAQAARDYAVSYTHLTLPTILRV